MFLKISSTEDFFIFVWLFKSFTNLRKLFPFKSLDAEPTSSLLCFLLCILQLKNVCDILSRQGSSVRERTAFVVFSSALLQSLQSMMEGQHFHTAQSVYKLLEPLLLQVHTIQPEQVRVQMQKQMATIYYLWCTDAEILASNSFKKILFRNSWCSSSASRARWPIDVNHSF